MITYLLQSSTCLILMYVIYHCILAELTFFKYNRAYLMLSIAASLLMPLIAPLLVLPEESVPVFHWSHIGDITYNIAQSETSVFDWQGMASAGFRVIYFAGVAAVLAKMFYGLVRIYLYYKQGQKKDINGYRIVITEAVHLPFSFFRSIYISRHVPLQEHVHTILDHEEIHIRQWHTLDVLMAEMVHAFFWFNPVLIYYKRALRQEHEYLADDFVCRKNSVNSYMDLLLSKSQSGIELALTHQFFQSQLKNRIMMLTKKPSSTFSLWKFSFTVPVILLVMYAFATPDFSERETILSIRSADTLPLHLHRHPKHLRFLKIFLRPLLHLRQ